MVTVVALAVLVPILLVVLWVDWQRGPDPRSLAQLEWNARVDERLARQNLTWLPIPIAVGLGAAPIAVLAGGSLRHAATAVVAGSAAVALILVFGAYGDAGVVPSFATAALSRRRLARARERLATDREYAEAARRQRPLRRLHLWQAPLLAALLVFGLYVGGPGPSATVAVTLFLVVTAVAAYWAVRKA